jgi:hypothetical protein
MLDVRGVERKSHVRYALESEYWGHISLFPNKRCLPEDIVVRLKELLIHAQTEYIDLGTSLSPFASDQIESMLGLIDPLMSESFTIFRVALLILFQAASTRRMNIPFVSSVGLRMKGGFIASDMFPDLSSMYGTILARRNTNKLICEYSDKRSNTILFLGHESCYVWIP